VVATGGLSIPKIGATSFGYDLARQFGLAIREPRPGLVPLVLTPEDRSHYCDLAGVSADAVASFDGQHFREKMLITHRGLSGPAILQISSYWKQSLPISLTLRLAERSLRHFTIPRPKKYRNLARGNAHIASAAFRRPLAGPHAPVSWTNTALADFEQRVHAWAITPAGTEGYEKPKLRRVASIPNELSAKTMESLQVRGLFFIGEVVDVTGHLGGFNFSGRGRRRGRGTSGVRRSPSFVVTYMSP